MCESISGCDCAPNCGEFQNSLGACVSQCSNNACADLANLDFGACLSILGYGRVDGVCTAISGCDAGDFASSIYATPGECAEACGAVGKCNREEFDQGGIAAPGWGAGDGCDTLEVTAGSMPQSEFLEAFPTGNCPTVINPMLPHQCSVTSITLSDKQAEALCAMTQWPGDQAPTCTVIGP